MGKKSIDQLIFFLFSVIPFLKFHVFFFVCDHLHVTKKKSQNETTRTLLVKKKNKEFEES